MYQSPLLFFSILIACVLQPVLANDNAQNHVEGKSAIGIELSSTGLGVDYIYGFSPHLHIRASVNAAKINFDIEGEDNNGVQDDELRFQGDLNLFTFGGTIDWYPTSGDFRVSAGLFLNGNNIDSVARCESASGTCEFGDDGEAFDRRQLGDVEADIEFSPVAPYIGIGYGNPLHNAGWGFSADLGLLIQGSADIELRSRGNCNIAVVGVVTPLECNAARDEALEAEERRIEDEVADLRAYPVVNLAVTYRFGE